MAAEWSRGREERSRGVSGATVQVRLMSTLPCAAERTGPGGPAQA